jgi:hypothetical protein
VLAANWLDALDVWALAAAEFAVLEDVFCPVGVVVTPCAALTTDLRPDSTEDAEIAGIVITRPLPSRRPILVIGAWTSA